MAPDRRIAKAFMAMKSLGISEHKVKPVLKRLLKVYDKNWELIEEENYRVLADAIFEEEDAQVPEKKKSKAVDEDNLDEETPIDDEPVRPLKRLRRGQVASVPSSAPNSSPRSGGIVIKSPKREEGELPASSSGHRSLDKGKSPQSNAINTRAESQHCGNKGKEPLLPQVDARDTTLERGIVISPKTVANAPALIKPKDEPFTDDMYADNIPQYEVPIAVIHPDQSSKGHSLAENVSMYESHGLEPSASQQVDGESHDAGVVGSSNGRTNGELATIPKECPPSLEIASSSMGEERVGSMLPTLDLTLPSTTADKEDMHLTSECLSEPVDKHFSVEIPPSQIAKPLHCLNGQDNYASSSKVVIANDTTESHREPEVNEPEISSSSSLVLVPQSGLSIDELRAINDINDVTKGEEKVEIPWVNEINDDRLPSFYYVSHNLVFQNARVNFCLSKIGGQSCCSACFGDCLQSTLWPISCVCASKSAKFAYTSEGIIEEEFLDECIKMTRDPQQQRLLHCNNCPLERSRNEGILEPCKGHLQRNIIKECWSKCGCYKRCGNRVVQRGINSKLQVFYTPEGKGWGLRTLEKLKKGAFVCEFVGEILTIKELFGRDTEKHNSPVLLDAYWVAEGLSMDENALCLDATRYGNVARFLNHRCFDANLIEIPVEIETPEHHYYHLAFFTTREVEALEELTWDYGIDFDDTDHLVKAFRCRCGSKFCRNMKRSSRSKAVAIV